MIGLVFWKDTFGCCMENGLEMGSHRDRNQPGPAPSPESVAGILTSLLVMPLGSRNLEGPLKAISTERGDLRRAVQEKRTSLSWNQDC